MGCERGAAVVEFAVIAVVLLTILFGILEFAIIFMQGHLVENAAREGVRVGVRANNYTGFNTNDPQCSAVPHNCNRTRAVRLAVQDYLDIFYTVPDGDITVVPQANSGQPVLSVTVTVDNFMPALVSALVPGYNSPAEFTYTATGFYEEPDEYAQESGP
jgi:Flp pilus assembly protein TadG